MSNTIRSVLLIDDDHHTQAIFELLMNHYQLDFTVAKTAEEGLAYLQSNAPDVIVLDLFMPNVDGYQTLDQIRKVALNPACPVVATTAYYTTETPQEVAVRGFNGYIPKPFDGSNFLAYLTDVVNQN